jgi:hypothetical protein
MTDFELLSVFVDFTNMVWMIFASYVSIVFAFIVAAYLVANTLTAPVVKLVISLYSAVSVWSVWALRQNTSAISATVQEMKRVVAEGGSSLNWVPQLGIPDAMIPIVPWLITILAIFVYVGSIVFFFYQRKTGPANGAAE